MQTEEDVLRKAAENEIRYVHLQFVDILGETALVGPLDEVKYHFLPE